MSCPRIQLLGGLIFLAHAYGSLGDTLRLTKGRTVEGIVVEETASEILLDIGMGTMAFDRESVLEIVRSSSEENRERVEAWDLKFISMEDLPESFHPLWTHWERLKGSRAKSVEAVKASAGAEKEGRRLMQALRAARTKHTSLTRELAGMEIRKNVDAYNEQVARNNRLVAEINKLSAQVQTHGARQKSMQENIGLYARRLTTFEQEFAEFREANGGGVEDKIAAAWLAKVEGELAGFAADFARYSVPLEYEGGSTLVDVKINGLPGGSFILDTGASIVTLTEPLARRLKLNYDPGNPVQLRLADGKESEGYPVVLDRVEVGDAAARNVAAVVVPSGPGHGVSGLLGMSFLGQFEMSYDARSERLELKQMRSR